MYHKLPHYEILGQNLSRTSFFIPIWSFLDKTDYTQMNITSGKIWPQCIFIFCPATRKNEARQPRRPTTARPQSCQDCWKNKSSSFYAVCILYITYDLRVYFVYSKTKKSWNFFSKKTKVGLMYNYFFGEANCIESCYYMITYKQWFASTREY